MRILHLSDTHSQHRQLKNLPKADLIIHSGDASENGTESEILDFLDWFCDLDYRHKILEEKIFISVQKNQTTAYLSKN